MYYWLYILALAVILIMRAIEEYRNDPDARTTTTT